MVDRACRDRFSSREENIGRKVGHKEAASDVKGAKEVESCEGTIRRSIAAIFEAGKIHIYIYIYIYIYIRISFCWKLDKFYSICRSVRFSRGYGRK